MADALFDADEYGEATPPRTRKMVADHAVVETLVYPWVLLADRHGVKGFHVPKNTDKYSTVTALCGIEGHAVLPPPNNMVRCASCNDLHRP